jgi:PilZ domain
MTIPESVQQRVVEFIDRRREPRDNQPAAVKVEMEQPGGPVEFQAVLVNSSSGGLAIRHWRRDLAVDQQVRILFPSRGEFAAQVIWNWSVGPVVISGLEKTEPGRILRIDGCPRSHFLDRIRPLASRSLMFALFGALLVVAGWYFGSKIW